MIFPALDGAYPPMEAGSPYSVWLGGEGVTSTVLNRCYWRGARFFVDGRIKSKGAWHPFNASGVASDSSRLMQQLLSAVAMSLPNRMPCGAERDRLVDCLFDQMISPNREDWHVLATGARGDKWITRRGASAEKNRCNSLVHYYGALFQHSFFHFVRSLAPESVARVCCGEGRIMPQSVADNATSQPLMVLDTMKPSRCLHYPGKEVSKPGLIITGKRGGLEEWARTLAYQQNRPLLVVKNKPEVVQASHLIEGARVITPGVATQAGLGKLRMAMLKHQS